MFIGSIYLLHKFIIFAIKIFWEEIDNASQNIFSSEVVVSRNLHMGLHDYITKYIYIIYLQGNRNYKSFLFVSSGKNPRSPKELMFPQVRKATMANGYYFHRVQ